MFRVPVFLFLLSFLGIPAPLFGQENTLPNQLSLEMGLGHIARQDKIFSPFIHRDVSFSQFQLRYSREKRWFQQLDLGYAGFSPMLNSPYSFTIAGETEQAYPHSFTFIHLDYKIGKRVWSNSKAGFTTGLLYATQLQLLNYAYGRIGSFGYYSTFGLGVFGRYTYQLTSKSELRTSLQLPVLLWLSRSPYLVNDDVFIENISSHASLRTMADFIADGKLTTVFRNQELSFSQQYVYHFSERWEIGAVYTFNFMHSPLPRRLLSYQNNLGVIINCRF